MMKKLLFTCSLLTLCVVTVAAQKTKPYTEWSQKEAEKVWTDSAWGQTQTESKTQESSSTSSSAITQVSSVGGSNRKANGSTESGESLAKTMAVNYRVRFLSAKPIRQAFVRLAELQGLAPEKLATLRTFIDYDFSNYIVVTMSVDGNDRSKSGPVMQELMNGNAEGFKTITYLERKDGKRLNLMDYRPPAQDGLGAKFVFPRMVDGKPFIDGDSGEVRFATELGKTVKLIRRFKVSEMMYEGKLEY